MTAATQIRYSQTPVWFDPTFDDFPRTNYDIASLAMRRPGFDPESHVVMFAHDSTGDMVGYVQVEYAADGSLDVIEPSVSPYTRVLRLKVNDDLDDTTRHAILKTLSTMVDTLDAVVREYARNRSQSAPHEDSK